MEKIEFFKQEAKKFYKDYKTRVYDENEGIYKYKPRFFIDIDEILRSYDLDETSFTLMNAQHVISQLAGFYKWAELLKASEPALEIGILLLQNRISYNDVHHTANTSMKNLLLNDWKTYEKYYLKELDDCKKLEAFKDKFLHKRSYKSVSLYYNLIEVPSKVRIKSEKFGLNGEYDIEEFPLGHYIPDLIKLANSGDCELLEVCLTSSNEAYVRTRANGYKPKPILGWFSLFGIRNGGFEDPMKAFMKEYQFKVKN